MLIKDKIVMKNRVPNGLLEMQWKAITANLEDHPNTINDYRKVVNLLHAYSHGKFRIYKMTEFDAKEYFSYLEKESGLSSNTVHRYEATLRSIGSKMEEHPMLFPNYKNPFKGILSKEIRTKTIYSKDLFPNPIDIEKLVSVFPKLSLKHRLMLEMMVEIGISPFTIRNLKVNQFHFSKHKEKDVALTFEDGCIYTKQEMNRPSLKLLHISSSGRYSYQSFGTWHFYEDMTKDLTAYIKDLGENEDDRYFFMTSRHQPYTYRAIHQLLTEVLQQAGLENKRITPYQLSLFGMVHAYLIHEELSNYIELQANIKKETDLVKLETIQKQLQLCERRFYQLSKTGWHGNYESLYPLAFQEKINSIEQTLGKQFPYEMAGC